MIVSNIDHLGQSYKSPLTERGAISEESFGSLVSRVAVTKTNETFLIFSK